MLGKKGTPGLAPKGFVEQAEDRIGQQNDQRPNHLSQVVNAGFDELDSGSLCVYASSLGFDFRSDPGALGFQFCEVRAR